MADAAPAWTSQPQPNLQPQTTKLMDYNIDDPFSTQSTRHQRHKRIEASLIASQKRRAEWKTKQQEKERIRRVKEEWKPVDGSVGDDSDASPDLMASPEVTKIARQRDDDDSSDDGFRTGKKEVIPAKDKSTAKKSNRSQYKDDDGRKENAPILKSGKFSPKWTVQSDITKQSTSPLNNNKVEVKKKPWQQDSSDESIDFESQRRVQEQKNTTKPTVKFTAAKKRHKFAESSSSSEDEAVLEERFKRRFEEKKKLSKTNDEFKGRYSSSSGDSPKLLQKQSNRYSSSTDDNPFHDNAPAAPIKHKSKDKRTTHSSSSEDEAELEERIRKSIETKRLQSYKRNPLSMAKKENDDWIVHGPKLHIAGEGLVGKEIVVNETEDVRMVKEDVSDLGGSQEKQVRKRRGVISPKKKVVDDLWDDWEEEEEGKKEDESVDGNKKKPKAKENHWQDVKKKRSRSQPKKSDSPQPQPRKRASPSNKEKVPPQKRSGRRTEQPKEESDASISDNEESRLIHQLIPNFDNPKLGPPGPLEPLILTKGGEDGHRVPASINRYLKDYQRTGIQFMYSSVIEGKGCVLGGEA
jgi:hypothetical protein